MEVGVTGYHGSLAVPPVVRQRGLEGDIVIDLHHNMVDYPVMVNLW